jgi:acyl-coenzyme A synthetase/AMP-(fatty) acid ligase
VATSIDRAVGAFRLDVPEYFNYGRDVVDGWAARDPSALALLAVDPSGSIATPVTVAEVSAGSNRAANAFQALGIAARDPVFMMLPRVPAWHLSILGLTKIGAIPMPGTTLLTPHDVAYRLERAGARGAIVDDAGAARVEEVAPDLDVKILVGEGDAPGPRWRRFDELIASANAAPPDASPTRADDPLLVYFTSGTTGPPKMVLHTHASYGIGHEITARFWQDLHPGDVQCTLSDTGWAKAAWGTIFGQWRLGATVFLWDLRGRVDLEKLLSVLGRYGVTTFCAPPTIYRQLVQLDLAAFAMPALRHVVAAGEPLDPETIERFRSATGLTIHDGYGQTETVNLVANIPGMRVRPGSMGKPTPGFDVEIVDPAGRVCDVGQEGNIGVRIAPERPVGLFRGYWKDAEATLATVVGDWYLTGDLGRRDEDGYLWFVGRADDVITSSAYRIGPFEVEAALVSHPAVAEAAVVGKPHPLRGEIVKAYVTLAGGYEPSDELARTIQEHCRRETAPYKYPREIEFLAELPKTASGKIRRVELRERERARTEREPDPNALLP